MGIWIFYFIQLPHRYCDSSSYLIVCVSLLFDKECNRSFAFLSDIDPQ